MSGYSARIVMAMLGAQSAVVILTNPQGLNRSYKVGLRDWQSPDGELYQLLDECPEIADSDARYAVNMALLEFQEYNSPFENPGHAD